MAQRPDVPVPPERLTIPGRIAAHLRSKLVAGIIILIPLVATVLILRLVFDFFDGLVQPLVERSFGREIVGVGIGITAATVYVAGLVATNFIGRAFIRQVEFVIVRIPIIRVVYQIAKQIVDSVSAAGHAKFRVVLVEWPREGVHTIGFVTGHVADADGNSYVSVLIPTTPTPQTGFLAIYPEQEVIPTDLSVNDGIKMVVSSGVLAPRDVMRYIQENKGKPTPPVVGVDTESDVDEAATTR